MSKTEKVKRRSDGIRRHINKQQAARHLIHAAIRMIMNEEDPFAIHLIVHSADKIVSDVARKTGKDLGLEARLRPEKRGLFWSIYREGYNYLKHADLDFAEEYPVRDIAFLNALCLLICVGNYQTLYGALTDHMRLFLLFLGTLAPQVWLVDAALSPQFKEAADAAVSMTPREFFETASDFQQKLGLNLSGERAEDTRDCTEFYGTTFAEHRKKSAEDK